MKFQLKNEILLILIALFPLIYLCLIWSTLPDIVPSHWNIKGEIDDYSKKESLIWMALLLPFFTYLIFLLAPFLGINKKLLAMGEKLTKLRFALLFFMSVLSLFIIQTTKDQSLNSNLLIILLGIMFTIIGNFMPTIKPNYLIGIRLPWTLKDENNWKKTHQFSGKIWLLGGISIVFAGLLLDSYTSHLFLMITISILIIVPILFSIIFYLKNK